METKKIEAILRKEFKGKASDEDGRCFYLTDDNRKCAIGCFIPNNHGGAHSTGDVENLLIDNPDLWDYMPSTDLDLLFDFQEAHDNLPRYESTETQLDLLIERMYSIFN